MTLLIPKNNLPPELPPLSDDRWNGGSDVEVHPTGGGGGSNPEPEIRISKGDCVTWLAPWPSGLCPEDRRTCTDTKSEREYTVRCQSSYPKECSLDQCALYSTSADGGDQRLERAFSCRMTGLKISEMTDNKGAPCKEIDRGLNCGSTLECFQKNEICGQDGEECCDMAEDGAPYKCDPSKSLECYNSLKCVKKSGP